MSPQEVQDTLRMNEYTSGEQFISQDTVTGGDASCPVKSFDMNVLRSNNPIEDSHAEAIIRLGSKVPTYFLFFSIYPRVVFWPLFRQLGVNEMPSS